MKDLTVFLDFAVKIAREAGKVQMQLFRDSELNITTKQNDYDVVTSADKASEKIIIDSIRKQFPNHSILTEESGEISGNSPYRWVIDPLDGTTNYSQGLPVFSVSIALEYQGETILGVVFAPYLNEMFHGFRGGGAFLNGEPIHCSSKLNLEEAVVSTGLPYDKKINPDNNIKELGKVATRVRGLRRIGSAAMDLCYVAAGYFDAYWELNLNLWDVAAGSLIAKEAGAKIFSIRENRNKSILASSPAICDDMLEILLTPDILPF